MSRALAGSNSSTWRSVDRRLSSTARSREINAKNRFIADGDLVAVHSHLRLSPETRGTAVVDIFRLENGKIVEHWDALQRVPESSANSNTMF